MNVRGLRLFVLVTLLGVSLGAGARAQGRLALSVVEVAGGRAYLEPGAAPGARIADQVTVGRQRYRVVATSSKYIVIELNGRRLEPGQRASIRTTPQAIQTFATRPTPPSTSAFEGRWNEAARPADSQTTKFVPLGVQSERGRSRAAILLDHSRTQPLDGSAPAISRTRLRAVLHAELARALAFDADASVELWQAEDLATRRGDASRPLLRVQELALSYRGESLRAAIGRLRYASATVGMLDGARASASLGGGWGLAAFGGTLADPRDLAPETQASRFGTELLWNAEVAGAPTRASLTAQGSRFAGRLDERRLTALAESYPSFGRLGARAEVSLFDRDNPWNAEPAELTALAGDASFEVDGLRFGISLETRRPERSSWLAAALPPGYFCTPQTAPGSGTTAPCVGGDQRSMALLTAAWDGAAWTIDAGASAVATQGAPAEQAYSFVHFRRRDLFGRLRLDAGASVSSGSLLESAALSVGLGAAFLKDSIDASLYYRPSVSYYKAGSDRLLEHGVGTRLWWALTDALDTSVAADLLSGPDVNVLFVQAAVAYRPRF
jgi:hypothetical protein